LLRRWQFLSLALLVTSGLVLVVMQTRLLHRQNSDVGAETGRAQEPQVNLPPSSLNSQSLEPQIEGSRLASEPNVNTESSGDGTNGESTASSVPDSVEVDGEKIAVEWQGDTRLLVFKNGNVCDRCQYDPGHGRRNGENTTWYRNGILRSQGKWSDNKRVGRWDYYFDDGKMCESGDFENGFKTGLWRTWIQSGAPESEGSYGAEGLRVGFWTWWQPDGKIDRERTGNYKHGEKTGN